MRAREDAWERVRERARELERACVSRVGVVCGSVRDHKLRVCESVKVSVKVSVSVRVCEGL